MGSDQAKKYGADGRMDAMRFFPQNLYSPRSDPRHPDHEDWLLRTDPTDSEMVLLLAAMREHGTDEGEPVLVYSDGGRTCVADGDRRHAACAIINAERKTKREPPHRLRALTCADPVLARALGNACRRGDPPMVIARRLRANMGALATNPDKPETGLPAAAAACGVTLRDARMMIRCLSLPADIQAKVGAREGGIPLDVAAAMAKDGSDAAAAVVEAAKNPDGKGINRTKVRKEQKAARAAKGGTRMLPAPRVAAVGKWIASDPGARFTGLEVGALLRRIAGDAAALDGDEMARMRERYEGAEKMRKGRVGA